MCAAISRPAGLPRAVRCHQDCTLRFWDVDHDLEQGCCAPDNFCFALCNDEEAPAQDDSTLALCLPSVCGADGKAGSTRLDAPKEIKVEETKLRSSSKKDREAAELFVPDHTHDDNHPQPLKLGTLHKDKAYCDDEDCGALIQKHEWCYSCSGCRDYHLCLSCGDVRATQKHPCSSHPVGDVCNVEPASWLVGPCCPARSY